MPAKTAAHGRWGRGPGTAFFETVYPQTGAGAADCRGPRRGHSGRQETTESVRLARHEDPAVRLWRRSGDRGISAPQLLEKRGGVHWDPRQRHHLWLVSRSRLDLQHQDSGSIRRERRFALEYLGSNGREIHWDMIRAACASVANIAIVPAQDLLRLGSSARMNRHGVAKGNWRWRLEPGALDASLRERSQRLTAIYGRAPEKRG